MKDLKQAQTRCTAKRKNGEPCRNRPILGGNVCRMHGGGAPQVRKRAQERILAAADMAASRLIEFARDDRIPHAVRLSAIRDLLDRAGLNAKAVVEVEVAPWQMDLAAIIGDSEVIGIVSGSSTYAPVGPDPADFQVPDDDVAGPRVIEGELAETESAAEPPRAPLEVARTSDRPPKHFLDSLTPSERRVVLRSSRG